MKSFEQFVALLQCPACQGALSFKPLAAPAGYGRFGILSCRTHRYPVIDDVPILKSGRVGLISHWNDYAVHLGPTTDELVAMLERGQMVEALIACLIFPRHFRGQWHLQKMGLWPTGIGRRVGLALTRAGLKSLLGRPTDRICAEDLYRFFYSRRSGQNPFMVEYWTNRFVMPRYLSAMALIQRIAQSDRPVLDIACGFGHFEHYLTRRSRRTPAVGCDFNFYQIWGAKRFVAPDAQFVCCDASIALPFKDGAFSAAICSDAFMFMPNKPMLTRDIERIAPAGPAIYARVGNLEVGPPNPPGGGELRPAEYRDLFGAGQTHHFADTALWKAYLERRNPIADEPVRIEQLRWEKYLSFVVHADALSNEGEADGSWCHGVGRLTLNPALSIVGDRGDTLETEFMFRSIWGGYEDSDMMSYTERWGRIDKQQLQAALRNPSGATASELLRRFVLVGVPDRFIRDRYPVRHDSPSKPGIEPTPHAA
ncbi:MAG: methyltransferase domain-containing protein [Lautropia sp.]